MRRQRIPRLHDAKQVGMLARQGPHHMRFPRRRLRIQMQVAAADQPERQPVACLLDPRMPHPHAIALLRSHAERQRLLPHQPRSIEIAFFIQISM